MADAPALALDRVSRRYNGVPAVDRVSLDVASGEFFSLVGPSGSGKTTTLRLIAGFDDPEPDGGTIRMLGQVVNGRRPYQRPIGMVFQNYALFPHLTVAGNVAFGLEERRVPKAEIRRRVERGLELVRLDPATFSRRRTTELSGRPAPTRGAGPGPGARTARSCCSTSRWRRSIRSFAIEMRLELRELNRRLGITFVLVTHDQEEALVMSDRVAVMSAGRIMQIGSPAEIYRHPRTAFVAEFIGDANIYRGTVHALFGWRCDRDATGRPDLAGAGRSGRGHRATTLQVAVRPEWHELVAGDSNGPGANALPGRIREINFLGETSHAVVALLDGHDVRVALRHSALTAGSRDWRTGEAVTVCLAGRGLAGAGAMTRLRSSLAAALHRHPRLQAAALLFPAGAWLAVFFAIPLGHHGDAMRSGRGTFWAESIPAGPPCTSPGWSSRSISACWDAAWCCRCWRPRWRCWFPTRSRW